MNLVTPLVAAIFLELFLTRLSYRWDRELTEAHNRERSQHESPWHPIIHAFTWWFAIPFMYFYGEGYRARRRRGRRTFWTDDRVRKVVGESQWHRRERLAREHQERADGVGMPRS